MEWYYILKYNQLKIITNLEIVKLLKGCLVALLSNLNLGGMQ